MTNKITLKKPGRRLGIGLVVLIVLVIGLGLDLRSHGLAWNVSWSLTGEEQPLAQIRGMVEWAGNVLRVQPNTMPDVPISHTDVNPYGINTFLQQEVEVAKREKTLQMIADAGFTMIRQQFPWADIEVDGRGRFTDSRNDVDGDGKVDTVDAWAKYDNIVHLAEKYHIQIQARLDSPPKWAHANPDIGDFAPPDDVQDFVNFAVAVASRYKGRIHYYQIWNEPNANGEWGNQPVNPEAYTDLLCRTYKALKGVDPDITVISAPLSPTVSLTSDNLNDFIYLQRMYDAGAKDCFDVMAAQGYGFYSGPTDQRLSPMTLTFERHIYIRDIMVANGDANKSIWLSEAAWNPQPEDPSIVTSQYGAFGIVTPEQAARYMPLGYERAQEEWPWIGNISYWFFKRPADYESNQAFYYFRMAEPDFTTLPVYDSMKQFITTQTPVLYPGVHQAEDWRVKLSDDAKTSPISDAEFGKVVVDHHIEFNVYATDVAIRWFGITSIDATAGDQIYHLFDTDAFKSFDNLPGKIYSVGKSWQEATIHLSITAGLNHIVLDSAENPLQIDSITVVDRTFENVYPYAAGAAGAVGMLVFVVVSALRERRRKALTPSPSSFGKLRTLPQGEGN
jgi:polysaccharide biosynthesis protein PslG